MAGSRRRNNDSSGWQVAASFLQDLEHTLKVNCVVESLAECSADTVNGKSAASVLNDRTQSLSAHCTCAAHGACGWVVVESSPRGNHL